MEKKLNEGKKNLKKNMRFKIKNNEEKKKKK